MKKVVIYTGDLCVHCDWAMELLNRKNIEFTTASSDIAKNNDVIYFCASIFFNPLLDNHFERVFKIS